jgi:uncharacterized protein YxeA
MKKIIFAIMALGFLVAPSLTFASTANIQLSTKNLFEVNTVAINRIGSTDLARLDFSTTNIKNIPNIGYWKIRFWCNPGIQVGLNKVNSLCGTTMTLTTEQVRAFSLYLKNTTGKKAEFSFKLKAYDKAGNWLHTEREAFLW